MQGSVWTIHTRGHHGDDLIHTMIHTKVTRIRSENMSAITPIAIS